MEVKDVHKHFGNKIYDAEGKLVLHVYEFDPLLEAGIPENCPESMWVQSKTIDEFNTSPKNIQKYEPLMKEFIEKGNIPEEDRNL